MAALFNVASISGYATSLSPKTAMASYNIANLVISHPFWMKLWWCKKQAGAELCQAQDSFCYYWREFLSHPQLNLDIKMTLVHPPPPNTHTNSMSAISQLLLTRFQPNFKVRVLGCTTTTTITTTTTTTLITTITTTMSTTSHLLMTWFQPSFKGMFLGSTTTITTTTTTTKIQTLTTTTSTTSHLLITWFQPNFKGMFLVSTTGLTTTTSWTTTTITTTPMTTTTPTSIFLGFDSIEINLVC